LASKDDSGLNLQDLSGVSQKHPWLAFSMALFLFSMAGIPPTGGFVAKYLLFYSAVQANEISLVLIGVLCSAVSVYYYLRVLVYMYMRDPSSRSEHRTVSVWSSIAVALMLILTLQIGIFPAKIVDIAKKAMISL
jgi:NADH-quinone oxidoreductase subunit N